MERCGAPSSERYQRMWVLPLPYHPAQCPDTVNPTDCPGCLEASGTEIERSPLDGAEKRTFECDGCGHVWNVVC